MKEMEYILTENRMCICNVRQSKFLMTINASHTIYHDTRGREWRSMITNGNGCLARCIVSVSAMEISS